MMGGSLGQRGKKLRMELLSQMMLGRNERLLIVQTVGRYFLLGSTGGGITVLAEFSEEEINAYKSSENPSNEDKQCLFSRLLENEMKKKQR